MLNNQTNFETVTIAPTQVTRALTDHLVYIGKLANERAMKSRTSDQVKLMYNPDDTTHLEAAESYYRQLAHDGRVVIALATHTVSPIGFATAQNEVPSTRLGKTIAPLRRAALTVHPHSLNQKLPAARITELNVLPEYWGQRVGGLLLHEVLEPFDPAQVPTIDVPGHSRSAGPLVGYGFEPSQSHNVKRLSMGAAQPTSFATWPYIGESVKQVRYNTQQPDFSQEETIDLTRDSGPLYVPVDPDARLRHIQHWLEWQNELASMNDF